MPDRVPVVVRATVESFIQLEKPVLLDSKPWKATVVEAAPAVPRVLSVARVSAVVVAAARPRRVRGFISSPPVDLRRCPLDGTFGFWEPVLRGRWGPRPFSLVPLVRRLADQGFVGARRALERVGHD